MTDTNVYTRQPDKMDYASPIQFRFKIAKLPQVEFFVQKANLPAIRMSSASIPTPHINYPIPGEKISYESLDISFLVDENLNNWKELHDWMTGLGGVTGHQQFTDMRLAGVDRFPGRNPTAPSETSTLKSAPDGPTYSDATLLILNNKNIVKTEVRFHNVFPVSLGELAYDVQADDVNYLEASASFEYMNYEIVQVSTT